MFRPLRLLSKNAVKNIVINTHRSKIIFSESFLDKAERMKLWHMENKQLFGSIIKEKKTAPKDKRKKVSKSSKVVSQYNGSASCDIPVSQKTKKEIKTNAKLFIANNDLIISPTKDGSIDNALKNITISDTSNTNFSKLSVHKHGERKHHIEIVSPNIKNGILSASSNAVPSIIVRNLRLFPMMSNQKAYVADNNSEDVAEDKILHVRSTSIEHQKFPSVSKILEQTLSPASKEALDKWKQEKIAELGIEGFEIFYKAQLETGSRFHELVSKHMLNPHEFMSIDKQLQGVWSSVGHVLKNLKSPKAVESHVVHPVLKYKGIIDCIAMYRDKPTLIEWKKSDKPKQTLSATYDNPVQLAAYFGAISHDPNYKGLNVRDALLVIAYTDGSPAESFHLNMEQMRQHWASWLTRLEKFCAARDEKNGAEASSAGGNDKSML